LKLILATVALKPKEKQFSFSNSNINSTEQLEAGSNPQYEDCSDTGSGVQCLYSTPAGLTVQKVVTISGVPWVKELQGAGLHANTDAWTSGCNSVHINNMV